MIEVILPSGAHHKVKIGSSIGDLLPVAGINKPDNIAVAKIKGPTNDERRTTNDEKRLTNLVDLSYTFTKEDDGARVEFITLDSPEGIDVVRHSTAHVMADAVRKLFPQAKIAIGPTIEDGFYYDFDVDKPFSQEDLEHIEGKMAEIIKADLPIVRQQMSKAKAIDLFSTMSEPYKIELLIASSTGITPSCFPSGFTTLTSSALI